MWRWKELSIMIFWWSSLLYTLTLVQLKYSQVIFNDIYPSLWYLFTSGCGCLDSQTVQSQNIIPECIHHSDTATTGQLPNAGSMLVHRQQRWYNIESPLVHRHVFVVNTENGVSSVFVRHRSVHCCLDLHMVLCLALIEVPVQCRFICGLCPRH